MKEVEKILESVKFCTLSTTCEDGSPWGTPVFFVRDVNNNIYWWSSVKTIHSKNIMRTGKVYITIFDTHASEAEGRGVYIEAEATPLESAGEIGLASKLYNQRATFVELTPDITTGKAPTRIFKATPKNIWMNAEGRQGEYYVDVREAVKA